METLEDSLHMENKMSVVSLVSMKNFWRWKTYKKYVTFYAYFVGAFFLFYSIFYSEGLNNMTGILTNIFDACVAMPQALKNFKKKSVQSLR